MGVVFRRSVEGNTAQCVSLRTCIEECLWVLSSDDRLKETQLNCLSAVTYRGMSVGVVFRQSVEGSTAQCVSLLSHIEESQWVLSSDDRLKETQLNVSLCCHI